MVMRVSLRKTSFRVVFFKRCAWTTALLAFATEPAIAESLVYAIEKTQTEDTGVKQEIKDAQKAESEAEGNLDTLKEEKQQVKQRYEELYKSYSSSVNTFNEQCKGKPEETFGCASLKSAAIERKAADEPTLRKMTEDNTRLAEQIKTASNNAVMARARVQKLTNYESQLQAAIARMKVRLAGQCAKVTAHASLEEMKLKCGNVQFDAASPDLPECTTERCRQFDAMQH